MTLRTSSEKRDKEVRARRIQAKPKGADDNDIIFANMNVYPILMFTIIHTMIDQY